MDLNSDRRIACTDDNTLGRLIDRVLSGRGVGNPSGLATYDETLGESTLFDDVSTPEVGGLGELILMALLDGLELLPVRRSSVGWADLVPMRWHNGCGVFVMWFESIQLLRRSWMIVRRYRPSRTCFQSRQETYLWSTGLWR